MSRAKPTAAVPWAPQLILSSEAVVAAAQVVDRLISKGADVLYERYLSQRSEPYAVHSAVSQAICLAEIFYLRRDLGEVADWEDDTEPIPATVDSWASGRIPVKKRVVVRTDTTIPSLESAELSSAKSGKSQDKKTDATVNGRARRRNRTVEAPAKEYELFPLEDCAESENVEFDELNRSRIEQKELLAKKQVDRQKKERREALEQARKIERDHAELAKKALTYDYEGKIIFTQPLVTKNTAYVPKYLIQPSDLAPIKAKRVASTEVGVIKDKRAPSKEVEFVKTIKAQSVMWDIISTTKGVIIRDGNMAKGERIDLGGRMTRKDYMRNVKLKRLEASAELSMDRSSVEGSSLEATQPPAYRDVPDYELPNESEMFSMTPIPQGSSFIIQYSKDTPFIEESSEIDRFNMSIVEDRDWGMNPTFRGVKSPARVPRRPNFRLMQTTHGYKARLPRERPLIEHVGKRLNMSYEAESTMVTDEEQTSARLPLI
jgi:hypothetical protein